LHIAWKKVKENKGAGGIDGMRGYRGEERRLLKSYKLLKFENSGGNYTREPIRNLRKPLEEDDWKAVCG
jgi:hypothetical protein